MRYYWLVRVLVKMRTSDHCRCCWTLNKDETDQFLFSLKYVVSSHEFLLLSEQNGGGSCTVTVGDTSSLKSCNLLKRIWKNGIRRCSIILK